MIAQLLVRPSGKSVAALYFLLADYRERWATKLTHEGI